MTERRRVPKNWAAPSYEGCLSCRGSRSYEQGARNVLVENVKTGERQGAMLCADCLASEDAIWRRRWRLLVVDEAR